MLLSAFYSSPPQQQYYTPYTPPRSSPLSERSANVAPRMFDFSMASSPSEKKPVMANRAYKPNPIMQTRDTATKRRREIFFKRVQNDREDKKWQSRGEQIQQLDFISERKRWEAEKARQAPQDEDFLEEVFEDSPLPEWTDFAPTRTDDLTEAEHIAAQEEYELQQLIAAMEQQDQENDASSQHFGSDDEDYDSLFMECASAVDQQFQHQQQRQQVTSDFHEDFMMDTEMTDG